MRLGSFDDGNGPAEHCLRPVDQFAGVAAIDKDGFDRGEEAEQADQDRTRRNPILNPCRMHDHGQENTLGVDRDVALPAFGFLPGIVSTLKII